MKALLAALALVCSLPAAGAGTTPVAHAPGGLREFVDDAGRRVQLPRRVERVFAAGFPADALLYTLAPQKLVGRNQPFTDAAKPFLAPQLREFPLIERPPNRNDDSADGVMLASRPDLYVDYGDPHPDYVAALENVQRRTGVPGISLDGALDRIPQTYRRLGALLGVERRGERLARAAEQLLREHRGVLRAGGRTPPKVYVACSDDGLAPCREGDTEAEQVRFLGAVNVAGVADEAADPRVDIRTVYEWNPDVVVVTSARALAQLRTDPAWRGLPAVAAGRIVLPPSLPYNWGPRPPSVNRLQGLMWLAQVLDGRPVDEDLLARLRRHFALFYQVQLTHAQMVQLASPRP